MRKVFLAIGAVALIRLAGFVAAQAAPQDQTSAESSTATEPDQGTKLRLARMDTSPAAFRKLDADNDGRISPLEAADNPRVAAAFTIADRDKDGYLSKEEFASMGSAANRNASPQ
jgi:hypothetical protein